MVVETVTPARVPVTLSRLPRSGFEIATGLIRVGDLIPRYKVVRREHYSGEGYQREPSKARVNKLANALARNRVDLPTSVLLSMRNVNNREQLVETENGKYLLLGDEPLFVVDGQHRIEALRQLFEEDSERWSDYEIPFVCMLDVDELQEMEQFYVVNSNAKSVPTSLAFDLLKQRAENNPAVLDELNESGKGWIVEAQGLTERASRTLNWKERIRFPRQTKAQTTIENAGFANSLRPLLSSSYFGGISTDHQVKIIDAYWEGIKRVIPDPFAEPTEHALQKSIGVTVMHQLLPIVIEIIRSRNGSVLDAEQYAEVMTDPLENLNDQTADGTLVSGADFWRSGPDGAAGSYSSSAGRRVLIARLKRSLPEIEVE